MKISQKFFVSHKRENFLWKDVVAGEECYSFIVRPDAANNRSIAFGKS